LRARGMVWAPTRIPPPGRGSPADTRRRSAAARPAWRPGPTAGWSPSGRSRTQRLFMRAPRPSRA
jgi:hypothetical protein